MSLTTTQAPPHRGLGLRARPPLDLPHLVAVPIDHSVPMNLLNASHPDAGALRWRRPESCKTQLPYGIGVSVAKVRRTDPRRSSAGMRNSAAISCIEPDRIHTRPPLLATTPLRGLILDPNVHVLLEPALLLLRVVRER